MKLNFDMDEWVSGLNIFCNVFYSRSFDLFVRYITGLLLSENKTVDGLNAVFVEKTDRSNLNRLLTEYPWHKADFVDELCMLFKKHRIPSSFSFFLLDDTLLEKVGKHMESAGYHYDHTKNRCVFGHQVVTSGYVFKNEFYPFLLELYTKEDDCGNENLVFRTKVEIAIDILKKAIAFHKPSIVLIDSWYCTQDIIQFLDDNGVDYIIASKSNRLFTLRGKEEKINEFTNRIRATEIVIKDNYEYQVKSVSAHFNDFGTKRLVFVRRRKIGDHFFSAWNTFITNLDDVSNETLINLYAKRFSIDIFHKEAKQHLGLGKSQLRKRRGVVRHLHLVAAAYCLLKLAAWLKRGWKNLSVGERIRNIKEYFERNTLIKTINKNKKNLVGAINQLFT